MAHASPKALIAAASVFLCMSSFAHSYSAEFIDQDPTADATVANRSQQIVDENRSEMIAIPDDKTPSQFLENKVSEQLQAYSGQLGIYYVPPVQSEPNR